jgi:hypothetical protein
MLGGSTFVPFKWWATAVARRGRCRLVVAVCVGRSCGCRNPSQAIGRKRDLPKQQSPSFRLHAEATVGNSGRD